MTPSSTLEQLEARAHRTLADASLARAILRHPSSPHAIERAWRLVATLRSMLAFAEAEKMERLGPEASSFIVQLLQLTHNKLRGLLDQAVGRGLAKQEWFQALDEGLEALDDTLEALYLARDAEFRNIVNEAIKELDASRPSQAPADWRASLANMPD